MAIARHQRIGFMQGRLSPPEAGRIQAFPWTCWREEFAVAASIGLSRMEWTLDAERITDNPLMTVDGRMEIRDLVAEHAIGIPSLTGDCFMQEPFWKSSGDEHRRRLTIFEDVVAACADLAIADVVVPLVDAGSIASPAEQSLFERCLLDRIPLLRDRRVRIVIESDFDPERLARLMAAFPSDCVGVNYDMGNSASLGWEPVDEIRLLAKWIGNVHVKDRTRGGGTVPLGQGAVNFPSVFGTLAAVGYSGNFILQTARSAEGLHVAVVERYADFVAGFLGG